MAAQTAVAIEILLMAPIRISNLTGLRLGQHVLLNPADDQQVTLVVSEEETKNGVSLEFPLPPESGRLIRCYIERFLPRLGPHGTDYLFPGRAKGAKQTQALSRQVTHAIRRATGHTVNPHLMRHLGAKLYLDANPGGYEAMRRVLAHKSIDTTTNFYVGFETAAAAKHFDDSLLRRRRRAEQAIAGPLRSRRR